MNLVSRKPAAQAMPHHWQAPTSTGKSAGHRPSRSRAVEGGPGLSEGGLLGCGNCNNKKQFFLGDMGTCVTKKIVGVFLSLI